MANVEKKVSHDLEKTVRWTLRICTWRVRCHIGPNILTHLSLRAGSGSYRTSAIFSSWATVTHVMPQLHTFPLRGQFDVQPLESACSLCFSGSYFSTALVLRRYILSWWAIPKCLYRLPIFSLLPETNNVDSIWYELHCVNLHTKPGLVKETYFQWNIMLVQLVIDYWGISQTCASGRNFLSQNHVCNTINNFVDE